MGQKKYHTFKNRWKLEHVTGKSTTYVYQDFWTQLFVYNMIQDVVQESNVIIAKEREEMRGSMRNK